MNRQTVTRGILKHEAICPPELGATDRQAMFNLLAENYQEVSREIFEADLNKKQMAVVLRSTDEVIRGFTTFVLNPMGHQAADYDILFSGDTIIDPAYWGSLEMMRGFTITAGRILGGLHGRKLYWLLTSKGHRTYMLMALFCKKFYPAYNAGADPELRTIAHQCGRLFYPENWDEKAGVLRYSGSNGPLKEELSKGTFERQQNPHVSFFTKTNPGFYTGDELVCLAELHPDNARRSARENMLAGIANPFFLQV